MILTIIYVLHFPPLNKQDCLFTYHLKRIVIPFKYYSIQCASTVYCFMNKKYQGSSITNHFSTIKNINSDPLVFSRRSYYEIKLLQLRTKPKNLFHLIAPPVLFSPLRAQQYELSFSNKYRLMLISGAKSPRLKKLPKVYGEEHKKCTILSWLDNNKELRWRTFAGYSWSMAVNGLNRSPSS